MPSINALQEKFKKLNEMILNIKNIENGMLGGIQEKYWVEVDDKQYLFKYNQSQADFSDFGEVFVSYICYVLGVKCVNAIFCKDFFEDKKFVNNGVLIESYRTEKVEESFSLDSLIKRYLRRETDGYSVKEILKILKDFCKDNNVILDVNIEQELKEMALIDFLLIQSDRHAHNIEFLIENQNGIKTLKLAPMFDNGFSLYLQNNTKTNLQALKELLANKYVDSFSKKNPMPKFYIKASINSNKNCLVKDLAKEIINNKKLKKIFENFCKLNISEELDFVCSLYSRKLPNLNKNLIIYGLQNRINLLNFEFIKHEKNKLEMENKYDLSIL